jgi:hypothetical protein
MSTLLHGYPEIPHTERRDAMIRSLVTMIDQAFTSLGRDQALERLTTYFGTLDDRTLSCLCYREPFCDTEPVISPSPVDPEC